jgi:hypothetical protein
VVSAGRPSGVAIGDRSRSGVRCLPPALGARDLSQRSLRLTARAGARPALRAPAETTAWLKAVAAISSASPARCCDAAGPAGPSLFNIRNWRGTQQNAFEELCFQLRDADPQGARTVKRGTSDRGVDWYLITASADRMAHAERRAPAIEPVFSIPWCRRQLEAVRALVGPRNRPDLNVELPVGYALEAELRLRRPRWDSVRPRAPSGAAIVAIGHGPQATGGRQRTPLRDRSPIATQLGRPAPSTTAVRVPLPQAPKGEALRWPATVRGRAAARPSGALRRELASAAPEGRDDGPTATTPGPRVRTAS